MIMISIKQRTKVIMNFTGLKESISKYEQLKIEIDNYFVGIIEYKKNPSFMGSVPNAYRIRKIKPRIAKLKKIYAELQSSINLLSMIYYPKELVRIMGVYRQSHLDIVDKEKKILMFRNTNNQGWAKQLHRCK